MEHKTKTPQQDFITDITDDLRGKSKPKGNTPKQAFTLLLLAFSALNTFRLFANSFGMLGLPIALAAIAIFDGGYIFWNNQIANHAKGDIQNNIGKLARSLSAIGAALMVFLDFALHSGQDYVPLDMEILAFGWKALLGDVFGFSAMILLIGMFVFHLFSLTRFENADVGLQQAIEERKAYYETQKRELLMKKSQNALKSEFTAAGIEQLANRSEDIKARLADDMADVLLPTLIAEWSRQLTGGTVIEADYTDKPEAPVLVPQPANPTNPQKRAGK